MDRRSRFSPDPVLQSFRTRAASQPPRASGAPEYPLFAFPDGGSNSNAQQRSAQSPARERPWGQRIGRSPAAVSRIPQGQLRSASFSATAHPHENDIWLPTGAGFQSTFEEDDEESLDAWTDSFTGQPRSWANSESRFRSQIPGTRSRSLVPTHGLSPTGMNGLAGEWNDRGLSQSIDQRFLSGYPSARANGSRAQSLQGTSSMPAALALRGSQPEISNLSPFVRDRIGPRMAQEDMDGGYDRWPSYMGTMREEEPGSGATSRRHSVSIIQPRSRGVGFAASGAPAPEEGPLPRTLGGMGRSMFSDEELAGDFNMLNLNNGGLHSQTPELHPSGATSYPYPASRYGAHSYSRTNQLGGTQGYLNLDTQAASNRTPSDGRSPIGDGTFPVGTPATLEHLSAALAKANHPANGAGLGPIRSRDPSPSRHDGSHDYSPVALHLNGSQFHNDPQQQQQNHGRNASDPAQGVPLDELPRSSRLVLLEFKLSRKEVFFCDGSMDVKQGDKLIVEGDRGKDIGTVINPDVEKHWLRQGGMADLGGSSSGHAKAKRAYAIAGPQEAQDLAKKEEDEQKALQLCQSKVRQKKLPMQVVDCEFQWDRRKLTFYFIAESRIDFRDLVRELFRLYKTRIWMSCVSGPLAGPTANIVY
ncbi:hypothetical protein M408DRAFT_326375 [Serendipita vermifera MAFF 305830]|uniref:PSP1 C-terminal domain-containing protein n=1 Tax=Serendipita vermifera MAFF 305830 TaxID=933852 RepID=A0A0C3BKN1_SERVB|nr:hypothetical protein M408DRAFT_326375 [Serendipita vermifera MAFF 305830]